ncbi:MAG: hypothetical protein NBV57_06745 [Algoriphagus sp.]|nr:hypothetical protein [Algoriphagus sp.]
MARLQAVAADPEFYKLRISTKRWEIAQNPSFLEGRVSREILNQLDSIYFNIPSGYEFDYDPKTQALKVFVQCSFDFYSIQKGQLIKEYKFANRGYTCGSYFFRKNKVYHILGGRGLWNYHADLMKFDTLNGSWEFIQAERQALDYYSLGAYQTSKGILAWMGDYNNPRIPRLEKEANGYFLDFEKKSWQPIKIDIKEFDLAAIAHAHESHLYETQDYALSVTTSELPKLGWYIWILIEKETGKLFFYEGNRNAKMFESPYFEVIGNKLRYFQYATNSITEGEELELDLDLIRSQSREIGKIVLLDFPEASNSNFLSPSLLWFGIPIVFLLALWLGIQIQKSRNTKAKSQLDSVEEDVETENEEILQHLLLQNGEKLSTEEFDVLLGIHEIANFDSKRIKRSRLIKSINKQHEEKKGFPLITRIKNPEDKRFVFYRINFESGN